MGFYGFFVVVVVVVVVVANQTDVIPPTIQNCPSVSRDVKVLKSTAVSSQAYAKVSWPTITATDSTQLAAAFYESVPEGFVLGSKFYADEIVQMSYIAVDTAGNKNTCVFFVQV